MTSLMNYLITFLLHRYTPFRVVATFENPYRIMGIGIPNKPLL